MENSSPVGAGNGTAAEETPSAPAAAGTPVRRDADLLLDLARSHAAVRAEIRKVIVGQDAVVDELLIALFARGHVILEGVPGLAKTLLIQTLSQSLSLSFNRIQFTPDLMPSDITGTEVLHEDKTSGAREFRFVAGPLFAHVVLADEINRTPPKTQAALLEAMQERQVTVGGKRHPLPAPFFVLATQNPIEQEGTYPLPEAQQDRFMFKIFVDYPKEEEEFQVIRFTTGAPSPSPSPVLSASALLEFQELVRRVPVADSVIRYAMRIVRASRPRQPQTAEFVRDWIAWGAGPRAGQYLILGAKARAAIRGQAHVSVEDVRAIAPAVLRHRLIPNFHAESEGVSPDRVISALLDAVRADPLLREADAQLPKVFGS